MSGRRRPAEAALEAFDMVRRHGRERHVVELDLLGWTVVEGALDPRTSAALRADLKRLGDEQAAELDDGPERTTQEVVLLLARGGEVFRDLAVHPTTLGLVRHLLGRQARLSSLTGYRKPSGGPGLGVHSDTAFVPDPLPAYASLANVNFCLTPYTAADGCLTVVPGSHRWAHRPRDGAGTQDAIPVEAPEGSAIVFHGNTWHGALPRTNAGHRLTLSALYCRQYMAPQERYEDVLPHEIVRRRGSEFAHLVGRDAPTGWRTLAEYAQVRDRRWQNASELYCTRDHAG